MYKIQFLEYNHHHFLFTVYTKHQMKYNRKSSKVNGRCGFCIPKFICFFMFSRKTLFNTYNNPSHFFLIHTCINIMYNPTLAMLTDIHT